MGLNNAVLEKLGRLPIVQKLEEEDRTEKLAERDRLAREIDELRAAGEIEAPKLRETVDRAREKEEVAYQAWQVAVQRTRDAAGAASGSSHRRDREILRREHRLREIADPRIEEFRLRVTATWEHYRLNFNARTYEANAITKRTEVSTTQDEINRVTATLRAVLEDTEALKVRAGVDIDTALADLTKRVTDLGLDLQRA